MNLATIETDYATDQALEISLITLSLNNLAPGEKGIVKNLKTSAISLRLRLLEMGLTTGTVVEFIRSAPMGDPIEISVRGYRLSLRREEAASIIIRRV